MNLPAKINQEFNLYLERLKNEKVFMGVSFEEELKYLRHNKDRYVFALLSLAGYMSSKKITILDVGTSPFTVFLKKMYPRSKIVTIDLTSKFERKMERNKIKFFKIDLNKETLLALNKKFDAVLFLEVIEHLKRNHKVILTQIEEILRPGGICIIQTPNRRCLKNRLLKKKRLSQLMFKFTSRPSRQPGDIHLKEYTKEEFENFVKRNSRLEVIKGNYTFYYDRIASVLTYRRYKLVFLPLAIINLFLVTLLPSFRRGMEFVLRKPGGGKFSFYSKDKAEFCTE